MMNPDCTKNITKADILNISIEPYYIYAVYFTVVCTFTAIAANLQGILNHRKFIEYDPKHKPAQA